MQQFREMQQLTDQVEPDYVMIISLVAACADLGALGQGMWVHRYAMSRRSGDLCANVRLANSFIDMYSRCGRVDLACQVFDRVDNGSRTRVTWNSMIVGFATNGCCSEALDHFDMMQRMGFEPDGVSFTGVLTACSHAGLDEGLKYYKLMQQKYMEIPMRIEHYGCVVDLLGRAGRLEEAMTLVGSMMPVMGPNEVVLGSLLAACRVHENIGLAEKLMGYLVELEPKTDSNFVLLSNTYASAGRWDGAVKVRNMMKSLGIKKSPGFSAVEIDGALHEFVSGDRGHVQYENIYGMLKLLSFEMKLHHCNG
nr:pentatricopeptide repeat protein AaPPR324 [Agave angustifolia]UPT49272.1 pentatricopeptide repeat protein AaPPR115 [Agave angustifolia]